MPDIHYGIENCHFAVRLSSGNYTVPVAMPGAVNIRNSQEHGIKTVSVRTSSGIVIERPVKITDNAKNKEIEIASLPCEFLNQILGFEQDENGVWIEKKQPTVIFAILYETKNSGKRMRYSLRECVCLKPDFDCTTIADKISVNTRKLNINAYPDIKTGVYCKSVCEDDNKEIFENWFNGVY